jgi:hypothetical protein
MLYATSHPFQKSLLEARTDITIVQHVARQALLKYRPEKPSLRVQNRDRSHVLWMTRITRLRQKSYAANLESRWNLPFYPNSLQKCPEKASHLVTALVEQIRNTIETWGRSITLLTTNLREFLESGKLDIKSVLGTGRTRHVERRLIGIRPIAITISLPEIIICSRFCKAGLTSDRKTE